MLHVLKLMKMSLFACVYVSYLILHFKSTYRDSNVLGHIQVSLKGAKVLCIKISG